MTLEEEIQRQKEQAMSYKSMGNLLSMNMSTEKQFRAMENYRLSDYHRQLAEWLEELRVFKSRKGQWLRMSDLSEQEDDRYKCSHCGNVIHHKNKMDLYTFNSWCGRCGSDNGRKIEVNADECNL